MWVAESQYEVLGTRFGVRFDDPSIEQRVDELLEPFRQATIRPVRPRNLFALATTRPGDDRHHAFRDCKRVGRSASWTGVLDGFLAEMNRRAIEEMEYFGVHAGVVARGTEAIAFPAASGAGKSTLVAACLKAGFQYVSDEALCLDYSTGLVIAYPKPLNLSRWSIDELDVELRGDDSDPDGTKTPVAPHLFGAGVAASPLNLSMVVLPERLPGAPRLAKVPPSKVVAGLLRYSFNHYRRPKDAFALTADLARSCQGWELTFDDAHVAAQLLLTELV